MGVGGSLVGALRVTLGLDTAQFEAGSKRAKTIARRDATEIQRTLSGIKSSFNGLVAGATVAAFTAATKRALDYAGSLGEVSQQLGVTTKDLQVFRYIASQVGVEQSTMDTSLAKLTRSMGEASTGSKVQATAFRELGVAVQDANGKLLTAGEVLPRLADAFARIKDPATRARLEADLFGRAGQKLDPLLTQGAKGVLELTKRAEELGLVLGDDLITAADNASDRLEEMQKQLEVSFARAVAESADAIVGLANAFATLTGEVIKFINTNPQLVGALGGAAIGARFGGVPGAVVGGALGFAGGEKYARARDDANMDIGFRREQFTKAWRAFNDARAGKNNSFGLITPGGTSAHRPNQDQHINAARAEFYRQKTLIERATALARSGQGAVVPTPQGALPTASGGGGGSKRDRTEEYRERFMREMEGLSDDQLQLQQRITSDVREQARLEHERIDTKQAAYEFEVESRETAGELTKAQADQLRLAAQANTVKEHTLVNWQLDDELTDQELSVTRARLENETDLLRGELMNARTQADRRRIMLAILDNETALAAATAEAVLQKHGSNEAERDIAKAKLGQLVAERANGAGAIRRDTMSPLEAYFDRLPNTIAEVNEALEAASADGLADLKQGLADAATMGGNLGDVLDNVIKRFQTRLVELALDEAFQWLTGKSGSSGGKGLFDLLGAAVKVIGGAKGVSTGTPSAPSRNIIPMANGGTIRVGGIPGTDRNTLAVNGIPVAKVSANETLGVFPQTARGAGMTVYFNGVMTTDEFWAQIQRYNEAAAMAGSSLAVQKIAKRRNRVMPQ